MLHSLLLDIPIQLAILFSVILLFSYIVVPVIKVGSSKKIYVVCLIWKPYKNDENCFLFHLKSSFRSQDIYDFVTTFWRCGKNGLIRKIRSTSKFMMSQPGLQTIAMEILPNISQSKGNQTVKFDRLIEYNKRNIFLQKLCRKWGKEASCRPLFIL